MFELLKCFQKNNSVMNSASGSRSGKIPLKFIDIGLNINHAYYKEEILAPYLLPYAYRLYLKKNLKL